MREIEGLVEAFKEARMVYLTTFRDGKERSRQMTNFNEDPYGVIWFPSDMKSGKVEDIKDDPKVLITFPAQKRGDSTRSRGGRRSRTRGSPPRSGDGGISTGTPPRR